MRKYLFLLMALVALNCVQARADFVIDGKSYGVDTLVHRQVGPGMVNTIVLNLGDDSTGITTLSMESGKEGASTTGWHTLDGRRLNSKPTQPGLYIQGGRKVVIK